MVIDSIFSRPRSRTVLRANPPNSHTGTLDVSNADPTLPTLQIPLQAYVNPACVTSGRYIFLLDISGELARFDPTTLSITNIGPPNCPDSSSPFSMAVDENAIAWAIYASGNLYRIDTSDASCESTSFAGGQMPFATASARTCARWLASL